jgi:hypothetical protein
MISRQRRTSLIKGCEDLPLRATKRALEVSFWGFFDTQYICNTIEYSIDN